MTEEERRRLQQQQNTQAAAPTTIAPAPRMQPYSYDLNGDALYQQYRDMYTQQAKRSMRDTMGQAAALTGGYGSTYAQGVGQQAYDQTMSGLTAMVPQLEQSAYGRWKDQYGMMNDEYARLMQLMTTYGYEPTAEELAGAGISPELAQTIIAKYKGKGTDVLGTIDPEDADGKGLPYDQFRGLMQGITGATSRTDAYKVLATLTKEQEAMLTDDQKKALMTAIGRKG